MNIDDLTLGEIKSLQGLLSSTGTLETLDNGMIGQYVIVRCRDAGVHFGKLKSHNGRESVLEESRRLWYWKCASESAFLSGVATYGLDNTSKLGESITVHLTENCEIILCTDVAINSIRNMKSHEQS